jgi:hypothetical protein
MINVIILQLEIIDSNLKNFCVSHVNRINIVLYAKQERIRI